jgi:hypothetical protein
MTAQMIQHADVPSHLPRPVKYDGRVSFGINYFTVERDADTFAAWVQDRGFTYNGGWRDGQPCGRDARWDYDDERLGCRLYAVTW